MDFDEIRKTTIIALFSDDKLVDQIVLKGASAISIVHKLSERTSLDIDFSVEGDFSDVEETRTRVFRVLKDRFDSHGFVVFDEKFEPKPKLTKDDERPWWGGYELTFKLMEKEKYARLAANHARRQIDALLVGPNQQRTFSVDFSKGEYTSGKAEVELNDYTIYVYTPEMVVIEKLRAICQQMAEYTTKNRGNARARDFYDIHLVLTKTGIDLRRPQNLEMLRHIFEAKHVAIDLLKFIPKYREFHRPDWPAVVAATAEKLNEYDFYFDFVLEEVARLLPLLD